MGNFKGEILARKTFLKAYYLSSCMSDLQDQEVC